MQYVYVVRQNTDLTEGRGHMAVKGTFDNPDTALVFIHHALSQAMGGNYSAEIVQVPVFGSVDAMVASTKSPTGERVWGYRKDWRGVWGEGWVDNRDAPVNDPEYAEYQRLRKKFGD